MNVRTLTEQWAYAVQEYLFFDHRAKIEAACVQRTAGPKVAAMWFVLKYARNMETVLGESEGIATALGAKAVRISRHRQYVQVEVPLPPGLQQPVRLARLRQLARPQGLQFPLGLNIFKRPIVIDLNRDSTGHALVVAATGAGKSTLIKAWLLQLAERIDPREFGLVLIDPKRKPLTEFANLPHLRTRILEDPADILAAMRTIALEVEGARPHPGRRTGIVIDELAMYIANTGGPRGEGAALLQKIAGQGRERGYFILAATQRASVDVIGPGQIGANFTERIAGFVVKPGEASLATGLPGTGAEKLMGDGDMLHVSKGAVTRFQAPMPLPDDYSVLKGGRVAAFDLEIEDQTTSVEEEAQATRADSLEPANLAEYLARKANDQASGITTLTDALGIGSLKAKRLKIFGDTLEQELSDRKCRIVLSSP